MSKKCIKKSTETRWEIIQDGCPFIAFSGSKGICNHFLQSIFPGLCWPSDNFSCTSLTATIPDDMDSMSWWELCSRRCRSPGSTNQMNQTNCICREKIRWRWICCLLYQLHRHIRAGWEGMHRMATNCSTEADLSLWGHSERVDFVWSITYKSREKKEQWSASSDCRRSQRICTLLDQRFLRLSKTKNIVAEANN